MVMSFMTIVAVLPQAISKFCSLYLTPTPIKVKKQGNFPCFLTFKIYLYFKGEKNALVALVDNRRIYFGCGFKLVFLSAFN